MLSLIRSLPAIAIALLPTVFADSATSAEIANSSSTDRSYAGILVGTGRLSGELRDDDGFANWGNPGSTVDYESNGAVGGFVLGRRIGGAAVNWRYELEAMLGDLSARTDRLDPTCTDEAAATEFDWSLALRFGVDREISGVRTFAVAGPALARVVNSVTDTDYSGSSCLEYDLRIDADDSFRSESTRLGWTVGVGFETEVAPSWMFRLEGAYYDYGQHSYQVNKSRNNRCGPDRPREPCSYSIDNRLTVLRIGFVYQFGH